MLDDFLLNYSYDAWDGEYEEYLKLLDELNDAVRTNGKSFGS